MENLRGNLNHIGDLREVMTCELYFSDPQSCEVDRQLITEKYAEFFDLQLGIEWRRQAEELRRACNSNGLFEPYVSSELQAEYVYSLIAIGYEERKKDSENFDRAIEDVSTFLQKSRIFSNGDGNIPEKTRHDQLAEIMLTGAVLHDAISNTKPVISN